MPCCAVGPGGYSPGGWSCADTSCLDADYLSHTLLDDAIPWLLSWVLLSWTMLSVGTDIRVMKSRAEERGEQSRGENIVSPVHAYARMKGKRKAAYQEAAAFN